LLVAIILHNQLIRVFMAAAAAVVQAVLDKKGKQAQLAALAALAFQIQLLELPSVMRPVVVVESTARLAQVLPGLAVTAAPQLHLPHQIVEVVQLLLILLYRQLRTRL
jgi:hypothetical protein